MTILQETATPPLAPPRPDLGRATDELHRLKEEVSRGPDAAATRRQHAKGKLTAHERLELLFDEGTFTEIEPLRRHRATGFGLEDPQAARRRRDHRLGPGARPHRLRLRP